MNHENHLKVGLQDPERPEPEQPLGCPDAREKKSATRPVVRIISHRVRLLDLDNLYRGAKATLDSLSISRLIPGDREDQIDYQARQVKVQHRKDECTVIELEL